MTTKIDDGLKLKDIQIKFNAEFPYLKIEFFSGPFIEDGLTYGKHQVDNESYISEVALKASSVEMVFSPGETVGDFERKLREDYGLFAHIFRKSGHVWIQPTLTNHWTLQHQNEHAAEGAKYKPKLIS